MNKDSSKGRLEKVCVDGGMTRNTFLMQLLANIIGIPVGMFPSKVATHLNSQPLYNESVFNILCREVGLR